MEPSGRKTMSTKPRSKRISKGGGTAEQHMFALQIAGDFGDLIRIKSPVLRGLPNNQLQIGERFCRRLQLTKMCSTPTFAHGIDQSHRPIVRT